MAEKQAKPAAVDVDARAAAAGGGGGGDAPDPNQLTAEEESAVADLRARIEESKKRGMDVALRYNDFELAQFVIVAKCKVEKAYKRFKNFHKLREKHKFDEMPEERLRNCARANGGFIGLGGHDKEGRAIICGKAAGIDPKAMDISACMAAMVLMFKKANPDIASTRRGIVFCMDMNGFGWSNFSLELEKEFSGLYQEGYPVRLGAMVMVDPPWWINMLMKIFRTFLKKKLMDRMMVKTQLPEGKDTDEYLFKMYDRKELNATVGGPITTTFEDIVTEMLKQKAKQATTQ